MPAALPLALDAGRPEQGGATSPTSPRSDPFIN